MKPLTITNRIWLRTKVI